MSNFSEFLQILTKIAKPSHKEVLIGWEEYIS